LKKLFEKIVESNRKTLLLNLESLNKEWATLWVHHYDPENKRQFMEYHHKGSSEPKKFKTKASAGKVMLTVFWDSEGVVLTDFPEKGATVNSE
jgi:hypothetical protein